MRHKYERICHKACADCDCVSFWIFLLTCVETVDLTCTLVDLQGAQRCQGELFHLSNAFCPSHQPSCSQASRFQRAAWRNILEHQHESFTDMKRTHTNKPCYLLWIHHSSDWNLEVQFLLPKESYTQWINIIHNSSNQHSCWLRFFLHPPPHVLLFLHDLLL